MSRSQLMFCLVVVTCGSMILVASAADPKKPAKATSKQVDPTPTENGPKSGEESTDSDKDTLGDSDDDQGPWEVTGQVELVFREKLKIAGDKTLSAKVQLKNTSDTEIPGKLVLVIDGTTVEGLQLHEPQGNFTEVTPYLQIIPAKRKLESGDESASKTLILASEVSTADLDLASVELKWRAFTLTKPASLNDEPPKDEAQVPGKGYTWGDMRRVMSIQDKVTADMVTKHRGAILGSSTSEDANGNLVVRFYAAQGGMSRKLPGTIDGVPVEVTVTGTIKAGPAYSGVLKVDGKAVVPVVPEPETLSATAPRATAATRKKISATQAGPPTKRFDRPVPIGVSSMNQTDDCAAGTLGCRCIGRDKKLYILSNNHVYSEQNAGSKGDPLCQPGPLDLPGGTRCDVVPTDVIGSLFDFQKVALFTDPTLYATAPINVMDAAIGLAIDGQVDVSTPTGGYGIPSRTPQENIYPGMPVQKYGRTTVFTKGKIVALNAEVMLAYGGDYARFRSCIDVQSQFRNPPFSAAGDSGSLVVTIADKRPIGILYAGGGYDTFLNPISPVLNRFKVGVDDGTGSTPILGSGRMGTATGPVKPKQNAKLSNDKE